MKLLGQLNITHKKQKGYAFSDVLYELSFTKIYIDINWKIIYVKKDRTLFITVYDILC